MKKKRLPVFNRVEAINRLRERLNHDGYPRLQMLLLVSLTSVAGALASVGLLHLGLFTQWLRYPMAVGFAYMAFLTLLWVWLRARSQDFSEVVEAVPDLLSGGTIDMNLPAMAEVISSGGGGDFGGGGASASFDVDLDSSDLPDIPDVLSPVSDALGASSDAEEFAIPLILLILVGVVVLASFFLVYSAPLLFAELLVDGALGTGLYRRLRRIEPRAWLETALRRTWIPFALTALVAGGVGWAIAP
jgi:hypothetical protein